MTIGKAMRRARKQAKLTLGKLGEMSGYNFTTICQYELDRIVPSLITVTDLADTLGISIDEYIGHTVKGRRQKTKLEYIEVVRCKDCKHLRVFNSEDLYAYCLKTEHKFLPFGTDTRTHYCSYGTRKESADNA